MICGYCNQKCRDSVLLRAIKCGCDYREEMLRNSPTVSDDDRLLLGALGLAGEAGEVIEHIKKYKFQGKHLDREEMIKELGDVRWYFECLMYAVGTTMVEVERMNIDKLRKRYPHGFTVADAIARKDES